MREYKFRAWNPKHKQMLFAAEEQILGISEHPDFVKALGGMESATFFQLAKYDPENCILMQFTGLKDKNGREIYEEDIILAKLSPFVKTQRSKNIRKKFLVHWVDRVASFRIGEKLGSDLILNVLDLSDFVLETIEVIGNYIENPELLE